MKRNQKVMWVHILIVILSIIFLVGVGIGSYFVVQNVFDVEESIIQMDEDKQVIAADTTIDSQAINLIYEINNDKIVKVLIEILNSETCNIDYITMPGNTELELSADIEKKLEKYNIDVEEQSIRLDELTKYYDSNAFQFGQLIIGDVLGIDISYYTVMPKSTFVKYFVADDRTFYLGNKKYEYEMQVLSETFITKLKQFDLQLDKLIDDSYGDLISSLNVNNKKKYIPIFEKADVDKVYNWHIIGEEVYGAYVIDEKLNGKMISNVINNKARYKYTQEEYNNAVQKKLNK